MNYLDYFNSLKGKKVTVAGAGVSNTPLIKMLVKYGADTTVCDKKKSVNELEKQFEGLDLNFRSGDNYLDDIDADIIFRSPGIRPDEKGFVDAVKKGAILTSEMEVFVDLCPCEIFAVTGSDGKTTTTTLISKLLENAGYNVHLGGNIGKPLLPEIDLIKKDDKVVLELSSFQLFTINKSPDVCVITNLSPNHLDWHTDYKEYIEAKKNIFLNQSEENLYITNMDNEDAFNTSKSAKSKVKYFSRLSDVADIYYKDGYIFAGNEKILDTNEILLPGVHNIENFMAAIGATYNYVAKEDILKTAKTVKGIEHRIEFVREIDGVRFYNDSIASSPTRSIVGLKSFGKKVIMIAGGYDKNIPYDILGENIIKYVKKVVLIGKTADKIKTSVENAKGYTPDFDMVKCESLKEAVLEAKKDAKENDVIILSPASASFDMFKNFEERGRIFKDIVNSL